MQFKFLDGLELSEEQILLWLKQEEILTFVAKLNEEKDGIDMCLVARDVLNVL